MIDVIISDFPLSEPTDSDVKNAKIVALVFFLENIKAVFF